jgi:glycosyltransferase involved in cell wall biosynthesis
METVEVIVPCYKYGHFLRDCVNSVLRQSWHALTVVIINDASPDNTDVIADAIAREDSRVSVIHHRENRGHIASYNEALARTAADYTLILSADDLLTPGALERAVTALRLAPAAGLCFGDDVPFQDGSLLPDLDEVPGDVSISFEAYDDFLLRSCRSGQTPIQAPTAIMRTTVQRTVGGFLADLPHSGDTEIWLRIAAEGGVVRVGAQQAYRRLHARNMSLEYPAVNRLREQERAFAVHFEYMASRGQSLTDARRLLVKQLGESAMWLASRAFDDGDTALAEDARNYAATTFPEIVSSPEFRRLRLKQAAGPAVWSVLSPVLRRLRTAPGNLAVPR